VRPASFNALNRADRTPQTPGSCALCNAFTAAPRHVHRKRDFALLAFVDYPIFPTLIWIEFSSLHDRATSAGAASSRKLESE
jgi:hypothetical protein